MLKTHPDIDIRLSLAASFDAAECVSLCSARYWDSYWFEDRRA